MSLWSYVFTLTVCGYHAVLASSNALSRSAHYSLVMTGQTISPSDITKTVSATDRVDCLKICLKEGCFSAAYDPADSSCSLSEVWHGRGDPTLTTDNKPGVLLYSVRECLGVTQCGTVIIDRVNGQPDTYVLTGTYVLDSIMYDRYMYRHVTEPRYLQFCHSSDVWVLDSTFAPCDGSYHYSNYPSSRWCRPDFFPIWDSNVQVTCV